MKIKNNQNNQTKESYGKFPVTLSKYLVRNVKSTTQWARDVVATLVICWIFIAMQTDYALTLK